MQIVPLSCRMRPKSLSEIMGQNASDSNSMLNRVVKSIVNDSCPVSVILWGPPGTGKTSVANAIANETRIDFKTINATTASKKDMQAITEKQERTVLFIDEIHRFNKAQQDYLLPFVENGQIILIGATTENPVFSVNKALVSRSRIIELKPISKKDLRTIIMSACKQTDNADKIVIDESAVDILSDYANGDARTAINTIEMASATTDPLQDGLIHITDEVICECIGKPVIRYDPDGEDHYNIISAFIKSIRGSDPDAALYYLALMIEAGEDPAFISRRLMISASEDIGLADSNALNIAVSAFTATKNIGMPEAKIILAHAVIYLATAPKSNSAYKAIDSAINFVRTHNTGTFPSHLKDAHYKSAAALGRGVGYKYPHDYPYHYVPQEYMPTEYKNIKFYQPDPTNVKEKTIKAYLDYTESRKKE